MAESSPLIYALFGTTVVAGFLLLSSSANYHKRFMRLLIAWMIAQSVLALTGFYTVFDTTPPRFPLMIAPALVAIVYCLATNHGTHFLLTLDIRKLTLLHVVRLPIELVLYGLYLEKLLPEIMTFEGWNPDILSGISAPIIYYFAFRNNQVNKTMLIVWNLACLVLLVNIVVIAILSAPTPFQKLAFDQPNIAIGYFPFVLLPCFLVPAVLLAHVASLRQLLKRG